MWALLHTATGISYYYFNMLDTLLARCVYEVTNRLKNSQTILVANYTYLQIRSVSPSRLVVIM